jgi:hypothetical protein
MNYYTSQEDKLFKSLSDRALELFLNALSLECRSFLAGTSIRMAVSSDPDRPTEILTLVIDFPVKFCLVKQDKKITEIIKVSQLIMAAQCLIIRFPDAHYRFFPPKDS